ncbi:hypothetical protein [Allobranchiibius sp. GilTou73]|uniref:hypothetical protein n=1 Tax=Allobranchiibius sp. GilTou73 TaxID=2904523 RepID=UPI001F365B21|nr:hypothetical protein [Allobranchiibius sp. GilTou73]UIJ34221.1 hypothetical protein LVQ62_13995 [Allobranchiibius sp. GilTou73]
MTATRPATGVLYLHGDRQRVDTWVRRGQAPCFVVPLSGWTAVVPAGAAPAPAPYDAGHLVLASRGVPSNLRSALGLFDIDGRAVVTVHPAGWRAVPRWLVWESGRGTARVPSLPAASPMDLVRAAGVAPEVEREVRAVLAERPAAVTDVLGDLVELLALPGERLVFGRGVKSAEGSTLVEPEERSVRQYERLVLERTEIRDTVTGSS